MRSRIVKTTVSSKLFDTVAGGRFDLHTGDLSVQLTSDFCDENDDPPNVLLHESGVVYRDNRDYFKLALRDLCSSSRAWFFSQA